MFEVPLEPGLAKVLGGECGLEEAIVTSWSNHVHLLPAGKLNAAPTSCWERGVEIAAGEDPGPLSLRGDRYAAGAWPPAKRWCWRRRPTPSLVCVMRDVSRVDQVRKTFERLAAAGSRPVGTVLNGVPTRHYAYRYGDYAYADK